MPARWLARRGECGESKKQGSASIGPDRARASREMPENPTPRGQRQKLQAQISSLLKTGSGMSLMTAMIARHLALT